MRNLLMLLLLSLFASVNAQAADSACKLLNTPYSATYVGSYKGWRIETTQQLRHLDKNGWELSLHADNFMGKIEEKSAYLLQPGNSIQSTAYKYERHFLLNDFSIESLFDWKARKAVTTGSKQGEVALKGGELDNINYQLQLRCDLIAGKKTLVYPVLDRKEVDQVEFMIIGEEVLDTKLGKLNTVVVKRVRNNNNRITTLWFARDMDYLMVKLLQEERKDTEAYLLYLDSYQGNHP